MKQLAHKTLLLLIITLLIVLPLPVPALADEGGGGNEFTQMVNGYQVALVFEKPASVGDNQIHIRVNDFQNMPISNADVGVSVVKNEMEQPGAEVHTSSDSQMADMPGMDMSGEKLVMTTLEAGHENGEYAGKILIETPGHTIVRVHLTVQGKRTEVDFPLNIAQPQNGFGILLGFFAVNVAIIAAAVILKPKPVSVTLSKSA